MMQRTIMFNLGHFWWKFNILQTEMTTRAELAFKALDKDNSGYITNKEMKNLSSKLSAAELDALMKKVGVYFFNFKIEKFVSLFPNFSSTPTVTEN